MSKLLGLRSKRHNKARPPPVVIPKVDDAGVQNVINKCLKQRQEGYLPYKIMSPREIRERAEMLADPAKIYEHFWRPLAEADAMTVEWMETVLNYNPKQTKRKGRREEKESYDWKSVGLEYQQHLRAGGKIPLKLVFASIGGGNPLTQYIAKNVSLYGVVHVLLQVGPLMIGWDHGCVIQPTPSHDDWFCERAFSVLPITYELTPSKEVFMTISEVIADYNQHKSYGVFNSTENHKAKVNCHCFAYTILNLLNRPPPWMKTGLIAQFLENIRLDARQYGKAMIPGSEMVFETHSSLDKYVMKRQQANKANIDEEHENEVFFLLKSFDRAFWLKEGIWRKGASTCPFMNPDPLRATFTKRQDHPELELEEPDEEDGARGDASPSTSSTETLQGQGQGAAASAIHLPNDNRESDLSVVGAVLLDSQKPTQSAIFAQSQSQGAHPTVAALFAADHASPSPSAAAAGAHPSGAHAAHAAHAAAPSASSAHANPNTVATADIFSVRHVKPARPTPGPAPAHKAAPPKPKGPKPVPNVERMKQFQKMKKTDMRYTTLKVGDWESPVSENTPDNMVPDMRYKFIDVQMPGVQLGLPEGQGGGGVWGEPTSEETAKLLKNTESLLEKAQREAEDKQEADDKSKKDSARSADGAVDPSGDDGEESSDEEEEYAEDPTHKPSILPPTVAQPNLPGHTRGPSRPKSPPGSGPHHAHTHSSTNVSMSPDRAGSPGAKRQGPPPPPQTRGGAPVGK